jgi:hypothetical protein
MGHSQFAKQLCELKRAVIKDSEALLCIANALVYKKTNSDVGYMFSAPQTIEKYSEAFAARETQILDGPSIVECKGCRE